MRPAFSFLGLAALSLVALFFSARSLSISPDCVGVFEMHATPRPSPATEWDTVEAQRSRLLAFLILAALYVAGHVVFRWVEYPLFRADDWYYFGRLGPSLFELIYRWCLTFLPIAAWVAVLYFLLSRFSFLTHRRIAFVLILAGLTYFEADMRWFALSKKHVTWTEIRVLFTIDLSHGLGLRDSDIVETWTYFGIHAGCLAICFLLSGPELRGIINGILNGPAGNTYFGAFCRWSMDKGARLLHWARADRLYHHLTSAPAMCLLACLILLDPVLIWALDQRERDLEESRSVIREIAETNPLRMQSLDRWWTAVVHRFSDSAQDLEAANTALAEIDPTIPPDSPSGRLFLPMNRPAPKEPENVIVIQVESLNAEMFENTNLPFLSEFSKKCLKLKRHSSTGNCTHYGILGLLHGNPVSFYCGGLKKTWPCNYLDHFKANGYSSRAISMAIMNHHHVGDYLPNWTEPVYEAGTDFGCVPAFEQEIAKPGPRFVYLFYNFTHYPYRHEDKYAVHLPEVDYEFTYNRSDLVLYRDQIINRYKNSLLEMDDWCKDILAKVDLKKTIVIITGDHGEELLDHGRLGHCSSLNAHQTIVPCLIHIPGMDAREVTFPTSHADVLPTVADALGWKSKPNVMGRSLFEPVPFRYSVVANFEYDKALRWSIVTEDRKAIVERDPANHLTITSLVDWQGRGLTFRDQPERWVDNFRIIRKLEAELMDYGN